MKQLVQSIWGSTVKLAVATSILAVIIGVGLVNVADVPQTPVVIGVMIVAFGLSLAATARPQPASVAAHVRRGHRPAA